MNNTELNKKDIFTIIFFIIFFSITYYLWWIFDVLWSIISITIYYIIFFLLYTLRKKLRKKPRLDYFEFLKYFLYRISILFIFLVSVIWWFSYYFNEISPASTPRYYLSNWEKDLIFQGMSHIWSNSYYENVKENITKSKEDWFVLFFEWVKAWTEENSQKFDNALWIKFEADLYNNLSKLYWLVNQDQRIFLWLVNDLDFNVDIWIDDIINLYDEKLENQNNDENLEEKETIDINSMVIETLSELKDNKLKVLVYVNRWILNFIINSEKTRDLILNNFWNQDLFDVILHERNKILSDEIINSNYKKIYVMYWLMHFEWVFELLKENDTNWTIKKIEDVYPVK